MPSDGDTIAAIATPVGQAGIGIIRISGPNSHRIAGKIFESKESMSEFKSHCLYLGFLRDPSSDSIVDEVLLSYMKAPHSYTREDAIEINSHSGYLLLSKILQIVTEQGARLARPGEFTLRAYLNGRIDLTQAEAVIDLVNAQSERGLNLASQQIKGTFRKKIETLRQEALEILAYVEVSIDFPEEQNDVIKREDFANNILEKLIKPIEVLLEDHAGRMWVDGINTVIVGRVNSGKSSILNCLLSEQRAIVTPVPGTTRDIIESTITINGLPLRLVDTAGFREVQDQVEKIGIQRAGQKLKEADLLLVVIDQSRPLNKIDLDIITQSRSRKTLVIINKIDLASQLTKEAFDETFQDFPVVRISALTGQGLDNLKTAILECATQGEKDITSFNTAPNLRHRQALTEAALSFKNAGQGIKENIPMELVALELKTGLDALGEIIGETTNEDILDSIFSRFCLGK